MVPMQKSGKMTWTPANSPFGGWLNQQVYWLNGDSEQHKWGYCQPKVDKLPTWIPNHIHICLLVDKPIYNYIRHKPYLES